MLDRLKSLGALLVVALVLVVVFSNETLSLLLGWVLCVYVLWRAFPALRSDFARLRGWAYPETAWRF